MGVNWGEQQKFWEQELDGLRERLAATLAENAELRETLGSTRRELATVLDDKEDLSQNLGWVQGELKEIDGELRQWVLWYNAKKNDSRDVGTSVDFLKAETTPPLAPAARMSRTEAARLTLGPVGRGHAHHH